MANIHTGILKGEKSFEVCVGHWNGCRLFQAKMGQVIVLKVGSLRARICLNPAVVVVSVFRAINFDFNRNCFKTRI